MKNFKAIHSSLFAIFILILYPVLQFPVTYCDTIPNWLNVGTYVEYKVMDDAWPTVQIARWEVSDIDYTSNKITASTIPLSSVRVPDPPTKKISFDFYIDNLDEHSFFFTEELLNEVRIRPIDLGFVKQLTYISKEMVDTDIGSFSCIKLRWHWDVEGTKLYGFKWVEENTGIIIKNYYEIPSSLRNNTGDSKTTITITSTNVDIPHLSSKNYELFIELDYMEGCKPSQKVIDYIENYFLRKGILVHIIIDDIVNYDKMCSVEDFWSIESMCNSGSDKVTYGFWGAKKTYDSKEKWVLFGGFWEDSGYSPSGKIFLPNPFTLKRDKCGNYVFISVDGIKNELDTFSGAYNGISYDDAIISMFMHELGHSIGITETTLPLGFGEEVYDPDYSSVMARMLPSNCKSPQHYSEEYWELANLDFNLI